MTEQKALCSLPVSLGIDTSNYRTSVAAVDSNGSILFNSRKLLRVQKGERGLRQSEALFHHIKQLPLIIEECMKVTGIRDRICCVASSTRPRPVNGSYMPVFVAGEAIGRSLAAALGVDFYGFSHQEGHLEAAGHYSVMDETKPLIFFHFSGGTTEAILADRNSGTFKIIGGSRDLAYGQVLDRIGVAMGLDFPCGEALDKMAISAQSVDNMNLLTKIKVKDGYVNLSGIETQCQRILQGGLVSKEALTVNLLYRLSQSVTEMTTELAQRFGISDFLFGGGVSCSLYMQNYLKGNLPKNINPIFAQPELSSDNAVGIALLGGKKIWRQNQ